MHQSRPIDLVADAPLPAHLLSRLAPFAEPFDRPTWVDALLPLTGTLLAPGRRTVTAARRILGREGEADYATCHRVLPSTRPSILLRRTEPPAPSARACRSSREVAGRLLGLLVDAFVAPGAEVVIGLDSLP